MSTDDRIFDTLRELSSAAPERSREKLRRRVRLASLGRDSLIIHIRVYRTVFDAFLRVLLVRRPRRNALP